MGGGGGGVLSGGPLEVRTFRVSAATTAEAPNPTGASLGTSPGSRPLQKSPAGGTMHSVTELGDQAKGNAGEQSHKLKAQCMSLVQPVLALAGSGLGLRAFLGWARLHIHQHTPCRIPRSNFQPKYHKP